MLSPPSRPARQSFFLPLAPGQRLCVYHPPVGPCRGRVLAAHAFAEEMNKSRRMAALQAQRLAAQGFAVLQIDLLGCGDSSGDFGDASWAQWIEDLRAGHAWLAERHPDGADWFWGLRAGCLLLSDLALPGHYLFWQPPASGKLLFQQFLRLKTVGAALEGGAANSEALKHELQSGAPLEVAGYWVSPALAQGLSASLPKPPAGALSLVLFEVSPRADATLSPAAAKLAEAWRNAGCTVQAQCLQGPAFWQTTEIEDAPALLDATTEALGA